MQLQSYTIYSTPTCHFCHQLKDWLTENGIAYVEKNAAADPVARQELIDKSHQMGVPVSVLTFQDGAEAMEKVVIGYDQPQLADLLEIAA